MLPRHFYFRDVLSLLSSQSVRNNNPLAMRVLDRCYTKWMCKYHIVFSPKYRRKIIYNQYRKSLQDIIRTLCRYKGVEIIEGHVMPDHIHLVLSIPPKISVSSFIGYLKGKNCFDDVREAC